MIWKITVINDHLLREYSDYYKIHVTCNKLKKALKNTNKDNIDETINLANNLLNSLKQSSTIDYEDEKNLVNEVYKLVYETVKLEVTYSNNSLLLDELRNDSFDVQYIAKLVKEDIHNIKDDNDLVKNKVIELEKDLDDKFFLDKKLLLLMLLGILF